ncbi:MAG: hypothetical protein R2932_20390 [Caldilineaceae bacterium]
MVRANVYRLALLCILLSAWLLPRPSSVPQALAADTVMADDAL